jgi:cysteine desulfurase
MKNEACIRANPQKMGVLFLGVLLDDTAMGIANFGEACRLRQLEMDDDERAIATQRDKLQHLLQQNIPNLVVNGDMAHRLAGNLHISIPDIPNSAVVARVRQHLALSTGSACSSGVETPSYVLRAMQLSESLIDGALRIGIGKFTSDEEIHLASSRISTAVHEIQDLL